MDKEAQYFQELYKSNPGLFNDKDALLRHVEGNGGFFYEDSDVLQMYVDSLNLGQDPVEEPEKKKDVLAAPTVLPSGGEQEGSSSESLSSKDSLKVRNILRFIGESESNNNPNRFRGDIELDQIGQFNFESMSIGEVLAWQENNKDEKGKYRAVGQYQFMPETLREFMGKTGLKEGDRFSRENQEKLTIAMLEEGGLSEFIKDPHNNKEKFSNTVARRFASMPLLYNTNVNGNLKKRGDSRYGGSNKALVSPVELENILEIIPDVINFKEGLNAKEYYQRLEEQLQQRKPFGGITTKFLQDQAGFTGIAGEKDIKTKLEQTYGHMGFQFSEAGAASNQIIITAPNGKQSEAIELPGYMDALKDAARQTFMSEDKSKGEVETGFTGAAKQMRNFMADNYVDPVFEYITKFKITPLETATEIFDKYVTITPSVLDSASLDIDQMRKELDGIEKYMPATPGTQSYGQINPEWKKIDDQISEKLNLFTERQDQTKLASGMVVKLLEEMGGVDFFLEKVEHGEEYLTHLIDRGIIDVNDMPNHGILVDNQPASPNLVRRLLTDFDMRQAYHDGQFTIEFDETKLTTKGEAIRSIEEKGLKQVKDFFEKQTRDGTFFGKDGLMMYGMNQLITPLLASGIETVVDTAAAVQDIITTPTRELTKYYLTKGKDAKTAAAMEQFVEQQYNPYYQEGYQKIREEIQILRDQVPETDGGIGDSESAREAFLKGGQAAAESLPIMAMYMLAPEAALGVTGLSVYGNNMTNYQDMMAAAQDMDSVTANFLAPGYKDLTISRARGLSLSKGLSEALITRAFTYNYVKGLGKAAKGSASATPRELKELVQNYRKSFLAKTTEFSKALKNEAIEENLITIESMFIDDINGVQRYNIRDYVSAVKETTLATLFTSAPMSYMASRKRSAASEQFVRQYASERFLKNDGQTIQDMDEFVRLDALVAEKGAENVDKSVMDQYEGLAEKIMTTYQEKQDMLFKHASDSDIRNMVLKDIEIRELGKQYQKADNEIEKETIKKQVEKRYDDFVKTIKKFDTKQILRTQTEMEDLVRQYQLEQDQDEERTERNIVAPENEFEEAIRAASNSLHIIAQKKTEPGSKDNSIFTRSPEKIDQLIQYLDSVKDETLSDEQRQDLTKFMEGLSGTKEFLGKGEEVFNRGDFTVPLSANIGSLWASLVKPKNETVDQIRAAMPEGQGKIDPFTRLESFSISPIKFLGQKEGAFVTANIDHMIKMLLKNDQMSQPLTTLSNRIDVGMAKANAETKRRKAAYNNLEFLGKVSKKTKKEYFTRENELERAMLAFLQKDVEGQDNYLQKKKSLQDHLKDMLDKADNKSDIALVQEQIDVFNRVVAPAPTAEALNQTAKDMNVKGIQYIRDMFETLNENDRVLNHMADNLGKQGTRFTNYVPTVFQIQDAGSQEVIQNDQLLIAPNNPGNFEESGNQTTVPQGAKLILTNFDNIMFNAFQNSYSHLETYEDMRAFDGVLNSKEFRSLFDDTKEFKHGRGKSRNKFDYIKEMLLKKTDRVRNIQRSVRPSLVEKDGVKAFVNLTTKIAATRRLAAIDMPLKQGLSAMMAQLPVVGNTARGFLIGRMAAFGAYQANKLSDNQLKIVSESLTQGRGGLSELPSEYLDNLKYKDGQPLSKVFRGAEATADKMMEYLLANSDKTAGLNTFLALYMDYDMKNNPEARKIAENISFMDYKAYWDYAAKNVNRNAIAYADQQVDRSQTQTAPWNLGGAFGANKGDMSKIVSQMLFLFGRFAYNRKVGISNDLSIIGSDVSSSQDKSAATRRLASAAIEIGVFKAISPTVGVVMTEIFTKLIGSLLGVDEALDEQIKWLQEHGFDTKKGEKERARFYTSNYKRNVSKEFGTALVDGFIPIPTPSVLNSVGLAAVNGSLRALGVSDDDVFNLYGPSLRAMSSGDIGPMSEEGAASFALQNSGILELVTEDYQNAFNDLLWFGSQVKTGHGIIPGYKGFGQEREVTDQALQAQKILVLANLLNMTFVPSADLNRFQRQLRGVIQRDFVKTRKVATKKE